jgi:cytochrome c oxidase cbb3-type subunit I/II
MPPYAQLATDTLDFARTQDKIRAMRSVGVPYDEHAVETAAEDARAQGREISADLHVAGVELAPNAEMVALIAYLQRLGAPQVPLAPPTPSRVSMTP